MASPYQGTPITRSTLQTAPPPNMSALLGLPLPLGAPPNPECPPSLDHLLHLIERVLQHVVTVQFVHPGRREQKRQGPYPTE